MSSTVISFMFFIILYVSYKFLKDFHDDNIMRSRQLSNKLLYFFIHSQIVEIQSFIYVFSLIFENVASLISYSLRLQSVLPFQFCLQFIVRQMRCPELLVPDEWSDTF